MAAAADVHAGVAQFSQHSYNLSKCEGCRPNTWHWSNFAISRAVAYTLLRPSSAQVVNQPGGQISFGAPPLDASLFHEEHATDYLTPVPAGARSVQPSLTGGLVWLRHGARLQFDQPAIAPRGPNHTIGWGSLLLSDR